MQPDPRSARSALRTADCTPACPVFGPRNDRHRGATWAHSEGALRRSCGKTEYLRPVGKEEAATILNCAPAGGFTKLWINKKAARPEKNQGCAREEATRNRKSTRLKSSHECGSLMSTSA